MRAGNNYRGVLAEFIPRRMKLIMGINSFQFKIIDVYNWVTVFRYTYTHAHNISIL